MLKEINKRFLYVIVGTLGLMILGLIFIGAGKIEIGIPINIPGGFPGWEDEEIFNFSMNGFDAIKAFGIGNVLSSELLKSYLSFGSSNGLNLIRCGIIFAVIFTPIFGVAGISGFIYDFMTIKNQKTITNEKEKVVTIEE